MKNENYSTTALILGIIGMLFCFIPGINFIGFICSIFAIMFGSMGKNKILESNGELTGETIAKAGIVLGIIDITIFILVIIILGSLVASFM